MDESSGNDAPNTGSDETLVVNQTISTNRWLILAETDEGYGLWLSSADTSSTPFATFGEDAEGFTAASREFRRRTLQVRLYAQLPQVLAGIVATGVILWIVLASTFAIWNVSEMTSSSSTIRVVIWLQGLGQVAYSIWVGSLALMVMLWLLRRLKEDPPNV